VANIGGETPLYHLRAIHLSEDAPHAVNTSIPKSCADLFSPAVRNLPVLLLFNPDMSGELERQQDPSLIQKIAKPV
jgi:hypothetical protein